MRWRGEDELELPVGRVGAHLLELTWSEESEPYARLWFASEEAEPWLHALVRYEGPGGVRYRLSSLERTAYWERD